MANNDLTLTLNETEKYYDISFNAEGDLANSNNVETAVLISVLDDRRAASSEVFDPIQRRGWQGNELNADDFQQGSKLWLLAQRRNTIQTKNQAVEYARQSLAWMLNDGIITTLNVTGQNTSEGVSITVTVGYNGITSPYTFNLFERN